MPIIALSGKAGAGKDSFADVLVKKHGFKKIALADPLRKLCSEVFRIPFSDFSDHGKKDADLVGGRLELDFHHIDKIREILADWGYEIPYDAREDMEEYHGTEFETPRDILRLVGTKLVRHNVSDTIWIDLALKSVKEAGNKVVITDCRYDNERDVFGNMGALLVRIKRGIEESNEEHEFNLGRDSEYDVVFTNDGTLHEFQSNIDMWYTLRRSELEMYTEFKYE